MLNSDVSNRHRLGGCGSEFRNTSYSNYNNRFSTDISPALVDLMRVRHDETHIRDGIYAIFVVNAKPLM